jgi:prophage regulatory protein
MNDQLLRLPEVIRLVKKSRGTIYVDMKRGDFPKSINIGRRAVAWKRAELEDWLDTRPKSRPDQQALTTPQD